MHKGKCSVLLPIFFCFIVFCAVVMPSVSKQKVIGGILGSVFLRESGMITCINLYKCFIYCKYIFFKVGSYQICCLDAFIIR